MYFKHLFLSLTVAALTLVFSCKKEPEKFYLSDDIKAYLDFKEGSYWVYKNLKTGEEDCTYVHSYNTHFSNIPKRESHNNKQVQYEHIDYQMSFIGEQARISLNLFNENGKLSSGAAYETYVFTNYNIWSYFFYDNNLVFIDTLYLLNTYYTNVIKDNRPYVLADEPLRSYYIKKNVGFVRFELQDSNIYELIRYNVIQ